MNEWFKQLKNRFEYIFCFLFAHVKNGRRKMFQTHLKPFRNHLLGPFQSISGVLDPYKGLWRAPKPYFGLLLEFWIIFLKFFWMNSSIEYSVLYWMNILDFVLNWIIFRPDSMKKWIFKTDRPPLEECAISILRTCAEEKYDRWSVWLSPSITSKGSCWHSRGNELCFHSWVFKSHQAPHWLVFT